MSRRSRSPAPPGRVQVICTGRQDPRHHRRHLATLQTVAPAGGGLPAFTWRGRSPVTRFAKADGSQTYEFRCGICRRNPKYAQERLARIVFAFAATQGTWETPVIVDISMIERAI